MVNNVILFAQNKIDKICNPFSLDIHILNKDTGNLRFIYKDCNDALGKADTIQLINGRATIRGNINRATEAILFTNIKNLDVDDSSVLRFIIEPTDMTLSCTITNSFAYNIKITGSEGEHQKEMWYSQNYGLLKEVKNINDSIGKLISHNDDSIETKEEIKRLSSAVRLNKNNIFISALQYVQTHPDSYFSAFLLFKYHQQLPIDSVKKCYLSLNEEVKNSEIGYNLLNYLYTLSDQTFREQNELTYNLSGRLKNIKSIYDVVLRDQKGNVTKLSRYKGKPSLLFFWGSWCGPCHAQMPYLKNLIKKLGDDSLNFLSISMNTDTSEWKEALQRFDVPGINLIDTANILRMYYRFLFVPHFMIIDAKGNVINMDAPQATSQDLETQLKDISKQNYNASNRHV